MAEGGEQGCGNRQTYHIVRAEDEISRGRFPSKGGQCLSTQAGQNFRVLSKDFNALILGICIDKATISLLRVLTRLLGLPNIVRLWKARCELRLPKEHASKPLVAAVSDLS